MSENRSGPEIKAFVESIARALVDNPDQVQVKILESGSVVVVELSAAAPDTGKIIGKEGRTAQAMRTLLSALGTRKGKRVMLQIVDK